jgi:malate/lactate dehydrogenase
MKIIVSGVGKLGSTVAFAVGLLNHPKKIMLHDIKDLEGDILDLKNAFGDGIEVTGKLEPADYLIITAGYPRDTVKYKTMDSLLEVNKAIMENVLTELGQYITQDTKVIVMTNPVERMTEFVAEKLKGRGMLVTSPEKYLMMLRKNVEVGWKIVSTKGYTNFGPAMSCTMLVDELAKQYHHQS